MVTATQAMQVAINPAFQQRVRFFMTKAAHAIMTESAGTANHADRVVYAKTVLYGTADVSAYSIGVVTNATIRAGADPDAADHGVTDGDMEFTVNSLVNAYAGVST